MKKNILLITMTLLFLTITIILFSFTACTNTASYHNPKAKEKEYSLRAQVISSNNLVECEDINGEIWSFYADSNNWSIGDYVILLMDTHNTKTIYDDEIISVRLDPSVY